MGLGPLIKSALKETIEKLPEDFAIKGTSAENYLLKQGVKPEEIKFAKLGLPEDKVTKADLVKAEQQRGGSIEAKESKNKEYQYVTLRGEWDNPTYKEVVYTFNPAEQEKKALEALPDNEARLLAPESEAYADAPVGYKSEHFQDVPNYLMHARTIDKDIGDGTKSRVILELQSDLHQQARQEGVKPDAPLEKNWLRKGMEYELARAIGDGAEQVAIPISGQGLSMLQRGEGVQKWYETTVKQTADKLAKATGGTTEVYKAGSSVELDKVKESLEIGLANAKEGLDKGYVDKEFYDEYVADTKSSHEQRIKELQGTLDKDADSYIVIKPGPKRDFTLYSSGAAGAFVVAGAMQDGFKDDEIADILKEQGYAEDEIQKAIADGKKVTEAKAAGFTEDEIKGVLDEKDPAPSSVEATQPAMQSWQGRDLTTQEPTAGLSAEMNPKNWPTAEESRAAAYKRLTDKGNTTAQQLVTDLQVMQPAMVSLTERAQGLLGNQLKQKQVAEAESQARQKIVNLASERGINLQFQNGEYFAQTESGKWAKVTPDLLDEMASAKGEIIGGTAGAIAGAALMPIPHPLAKFLGSAAGAAAGAAAGTQLDYLYSAIKTSEDMNAQVALNKALTAAELSLVGDTIAYPIAKLGGAAVRGIKRAKDLIIDGNSAGAYQALKDTMFISDHEAQQLVEGLQKFAAVPGGNPAEQRIASTVLTKPGGEAIVQSVVRDNPKASQAVVQALDSRAQDLMKTSQDLSGEDVAKLLREDLDNYVADVKGYYGSVKDRVLKAPNADKIQFDYDGLAIEPVLARLQANIQDPTVLQRFVAQAQRIRETSDSRSFGDLLELRHLVNDFKFNKRIASAKDYDALNEVLTKIDGAVKQSAEAVMPDSKQWLTDWASARAKYAQMMRTQENVLVKALRSPSITEADIGNRLVKHIQTVDGTLEEVLGKLPANARKRAEGAVLNTLVNKMTAGAEGGLRATDFPSLAKELDKITFTTKEPRQLKIAINKMADVFKNDLALAKASGRVYFQRPGGFLADDLTSKFKYQAAQNIFQNVQKMLPTEQGRGIALIAKAAELLENPLHAKTAKELMDEYADVANIPDMIKKAQVEAAREAAEGKTSANVNLYGDGKVLSTKGSGAKQQIPLHRIATADQVKELSETYGIAPSNTKELEALLKSQGFKGVMQGSDKVRKL